MAEMDDKTKVAIIAQMLGHTRADEEGQMTVITPGVASEGIEARAVKLRDSLRLITTREELAALPDYSIIVGEIMEYTGITTLTKMSQGWSAEYIAGLGHDPCWYTFIMCEDGSVEIVDDYTPELPVLLLVEGVEDIDDEDAY